MSEHIPEDGLEPEAELRDALDRVRVPAARADFREELARAFVGGAAQDGREGGEGDEQCLASLLDGFQPEPARAEFRQELLEQFLRGDQRKARPQVRRSVRSARRRAAPRSARKQSWRWRLLVGGGLAAAAALLLWFRSSHEAGSDWSVQSDLSAHQDLMIDGKRPSASGPAALAKRLNTARILETGQQGLNLRFGDLLYLEMGPESILDLSGMPADGDEGDLTLASSKGIFRLATGPDFGGGRRLVFDTPDIEASVVGTIFGVDVYPEKGTCVCCIESEVLVRSNTPGQGEQRVLEDRTDFVDKNGQHQAIEMPGSHAGPLRAMQVEW